jgi:hypothetical protein
MPHCILLRGVPRAERKGSPTPVETGTLVLMSDDSVPVTPLLRIQGVRPEASIDEIASLLAALPDGAEGEYDKDVGAVVVRVYGRAPLMGKVMRVMSDSGIVLGNPGTEEAILKYRPDRRNEPAEWDVLGADWAICTTCNGWSTPRVNGQKALEAEMRRHTNRVHGGRRT